MAPVAFIKYMFISYNMYRSRQRHSWKNLRWPCFKFVLHCSVQNNSLMCQFSWYWHEMHKSTNYCSYLPYAVIRASVFSSDFDWLRHLAHFVHQKIFLNFFTTLEANASKKACNMGKWELFLYSKAGHIRLIRQCRAIQIASRRLITVARHRCVQVYAWHVC